ncbi:MAG: hypothetical protein COU63_03185 [Candidatus Pacebacteria bacterium CG10_big_fil_rev_8_21_14_0_10_36_11]|nr:HAMP domain-containing histidine kinase [Candidatus Pacearchaeota archaeon]OIP74428.1 MAG: hypothetical protein AUK08_01435 [Candidatus Pacebacteria bacterium CG2_30_36_39]PIR64992.1 MAG: hypothetical protein COU63_03185 [Candidatus Pacebacteria bacterium CG10_big_fil_rev_8_21_14_0_10_36_11]
MVKNTLFSTTPILQHSLATPLTNILSLSELALENIKQENLYKPEQELQRVLLNAKHMQSMLAFRDRQQRYVFSPQKAINELLCINDQTRIKKNLVTRIVIPANKFLCGNKLLFQEIVVCLLNNAHESYNKKTKHKLVFLSAINKNSNCLLSVVDAGKGMNWWEKQMALKPFSSFKQNHSGLGLFFVKQTVEKEFNGSVNIRSKIKQGTTIELSFPYYMQ